MMCIYIFLIVPVSLIVIGAKSSKHMVIYEIIFVLTSSLPLSAATYYSAEADQMQKKPFLWNIFQIGSVGSISLLLTSFIKLYIFRNESFNFSENLGEEMGEMIEKVAKQYLPTRRDDKGATQQIHPETTQKDVIRGQDNQTDEAANLNNA
eukprot:TRINITY_DN641_c0_g5_i1.p2 TRINITY_DN641_c0_g5~~TRINITY_DN641_c0_g5_i1.p2  ORF type:complete len:151 (+),score=0.95 TRINITY_DN641_c0_g5_i1:782-1234(+)